MDEFYLRDKIFSLEHPAEFEETAMLVFQFQFNNNPVFKNFATLVNHKPSNIREVERIPFLPAGFFRNHSILTGIHNDSSSLTFVSSGTGFNTPSIHTVTHPDIYRQSFMSGFERVFGHVTSYDIFALLPSYLERGNSSLVYMVDCLIKASKSETGGFFINDYERLYYGLLDSSSSSSRKTILIGVTFALLDFMKSFKNPVPGLTLVETGGMKGRGKEMIREELYNLLREGYGIENIHSEYGMTELCSQAWSLDNGVYHTPPWMKILIRDINDPFRILPPGKRGAINVIDLANLYSCSFIATEDIGKLNPDGSFEVLGRIDGSEARGCNLLTMPVL